jgi:hypothetical protein
MYMDRKKFYVIVKVGNGRPRKFYFDGSPTTKQWEFTWDITTPEKTTESVKKMEQRLSEAQKYQGISGLDAHISIDWDNFWKLKEGGLNAMFEHLNTMAHTSINDPDYFEQMPVLPEGIVSKQAEIVQKNKMRA